MNSPTDNNTFKSLGISDILSIQSAILREPSSTRPIIRLAEKNGVRVIIKDFSENRFFFRNTVGRFLIWREAKAYRRLHGLSGIPRFFGVIDGLALVIEAVEAESVENLEKQGTLPWSFFNDMSRLVAAFHERGVAHCDLKRAPNTLLGENGEPYIVDWAAAILREEFRIPPLNLIYRRFLRDDEQAIVKLALRHQPDRLSEAAKSRYFYRSSGEKLIRAIRDKLREWLQKSV